MSTSVRRNGTWTAAKLSTIARVVRGRVKPKDHPKLPFVGMDNVEAHTMRLLGTVPSSTMKSASVHFRPGDVLYGRLRPYLNKVLAPDFEGLASAEFIPLTTHDGILPTFLQYRLNAADFVTYASHLNEGDRPRVDFDQIGSFEIELPPSGEQHRIVDAIESYFTRLDDAVATLERVRRNLKRYRASVLKAAVEGRLVPTEAELARAEGRDYEPASVLLERILVERRRRWEEAELARMKAKGTVPKDDKWKEKYKEPVPPGTSDLPELPEGWCWASVDQLERGERRSAYGVLVPGPHIPAGIPLVRVGDINGGRIELGRLKRIDRKIADKFAKTYLQGGEVLLTLVGTIGRTAVVPAALAGANVARAVGVIPASDLVDAYWIENWFRSPTTRHRVVGKAHEVARKTLNLEDVRAAPVALPPRREQGVIRDAVDDHESVIDSLTEAIRNSVLRCVRLRQSILKWAFEGRLVDQDPTDEPASKLLERIRAERESTNSDPRRNPRRPRARSPKA